MSLRHQCVLNFQQAVPLPEVRVRQTVAELAHYQDSEIRDLGC